MNDVEEIDLSPSRIDAIVTQPDRPTEEGPQGTDWASRQQSTEQATGVGQAMPTSAVRHVLPVPSAAEAPYSFRLLQQWEGTVTGIAVDEFTAELRDLTEPANHREEATFDLDEVSPGDRQLMALGAVFRWSIGYRTSSAGQRERVSQLRFVRIPGWRRAAIAEVKQRAAELRERFPLT